MSSLDDPSAPALKPGDWFTTNDEFLDQPSFLRDPEETYHRFQEQQQRPPHGMPMQVIVVHEYYIYASTMAWNGQPWCPVIVDVRQHPVMRLPAWVAGRITKHLRDKQQTRQPRVQQRKPQSQDTQETPDRHRQTGDQGERDSRATRATASQATTKLSTTPTAGQASVPPARTSEPSVDERPWIHLDLRLHPRAALRDLGRFGRTITGLFRRPPRDRRGARPRTDSSD